MKLERRLRFEKRERSQDFEEGRDYYLKHGIIVVHKIHKHWGILHVQTIYLYQKNIHICTRALSRFVF